MSIGLISRGVGKFKSTFLHLYQGDIITIRLSVGCRFIPAAFDLWVRKKTRVISHCQLVTQSIETRIRSSKVLQISLVLIVIMKHWHDSSFMLQNLCLRVSRIIVQTNKPYHNSESTFTSKHNQKTVHPPRITPHSEFAVRRKVLRKKGKINGGNWSLC